MNGRPLDVSDPKTFDRWCATPAYDMRTIEEFAEDGGLPAFPPNKDVRILGEARALAGIPTGNRGKR